MADIYTDTGFTLVTTADKIIYTVDNTPHDELMSMLTNPVCGINTHHNRDFVHDGDLSITGDLTVSGGVFEVKSTNTVIRDNNITINIGQANQTSAGLQVITSAADLAYFGTDGSGEFVCGLAGAEKRIAYEDSRGIIVLLASATNITNDAVPVFQAQSIAYSHPLSSDFFASTSAVEIPLTLGAWQVVVENYDVEKINKNKWIAPTTHGGLGVALGLNTNRSALAGAGTRNYALAIGGSSGGSDLSTITEYFNGDAWVNTGSLNKGASGLAGCGIVNAALVWNGASGTTPDYSTDNEKFSGFSWSVAGSGPATGISQNAVFSGGCGRQNAALSAGGAIGATYNIILNTAYRYDGVTWATAGTGVNMYQAGVRGALMGTQNDAVFAGYGTSMVADSLYSQKYNGFTDSWAVLPSINSAKQGCAGVGVMNSCRIIGGLVGGTGGTATKSVEKFNGFVWINEGDALVTARQDHAGAGTANGAIIFGGSDTSSEIYFGEFTAKFALWVDTNADSNDAMVTSISATTDIQLVAEVFQDENLGSTDAEKSYIAELQKEDWNTGFWMVTANLPASTSAHYMAGFGTPNKTLACGGSLNGSGYQNVNWSFDGVSWSALGSTLNLGRQYHEATGCYNSGVTYGGASGASTYLTSTETFNGVSWNNSGALNAGRITHAGCGIKNAALAIAGQTAGSAYLKSIEKFNGSTWATGTDIDVETYNVNHSAFGVWNAAVNFGGITSGSFPNPVATSRMYNGSAWFLGPSINVALYSSPGAGKYNNGIKAGGATGAVGQNTTERFNGLLWYITGNMTSGRYLSETSSGTGNNLVTWGGSAGAPVSTNSESYHTGTGGVDFLPYPGKYVYAYK